MRACAILAALAACPALGAAEGPLPLDGLDLTGVAVVQPKGGDATKPTEIKTADELEKSPLFGEGAAEKLKKHVNFDREKLVVFAWSGSGKDVVSGKFAVVGDKQSQAVFLFTPGATRDLRPHFRVFAVPRGAEVKAMKDPHVPK